MSVVGAAAPGNEMAEVEVASLMPVDAPNQPAAARVSVTIAKSSMLLEDEMLARRIVDVVNRAYGYRRISEGEVRDRVGKGDMGCCSNRVLHIAWRGGEAVGVCSSTIQAPFTCVGCGHWGILAVDPSAQGTGVARALVAAAEHRLARAGCIAVQVEYTYVVGDEASERLRMWYEGSLGFGCISGAPGTQRGHREFRMCHKRLCPTGCSHCCHLCVVS